MFNKKKTINSIIIEVTKEFLAVQESKKYEINTRRFIRKRSMESKRVSCSGV